MAARMEPLSGGEGSPDPAGRLTPEREEEERG